MRNALDGLLLLFVFRDEDFRDVDIDFLTYRHPLYQGDVRFAEDMQSSRTVQYSLGKVQGGIGVVQIGGEGM
ncbi:MAG: hypothetical protein LBK75_11090 [Oscillospiraceae bacterium]|jgi:hypothetical protein|nr:hypothetical protein [Oscillospiraceae bacterium]